MVCLVTSLPTTKAKNGSILLLGLALVLVGSLPGLSDASAILYV